MLEGHGNDAYRFNYTIKADFSTNVWYGAEPAGLKEYLFSKWQSINSYPEVLAESLGELIAVHHDVSAQQVLINSGTTESIYLIAQAFFGKRTTVVVPTFSEYEDACKMNGHTVTYLPWPSSEDDLPAVTTDLLFICNPNNPTGANFYSLEKWISLYPATLFIVDEAFIEFTLNLPSAISLTKIYPNLIVMRSMTKTYSIPGLRLGYLIAPELIVQKLKKYKQPWTVNTLALEAGKFIINNFTTCQPPIEKLLADKKDFVELLKKNSNLEVLESTTHFFLVRDKRRSAAELKKWLLEKHEFLIRDASNFHGLDKHFFRLATLHHSNNQLLAECLY